jgi:ribosomal protein S6--L-glutamate ligase
MFYGLESRGTDIFPPLLSQSLSLSKVHQALHFMDYMIPDTQVLFRTSSIEKLLRKYEERNIVKTVVKEDRGSMGMGNHPCWSLNELAWMIVHVTPLPVVVQPMLEDFREYRLVIMGDTMVAKEKIGSHSVFWNNRIFGGITKRIEPTKELAVFAKEMMQIGKFPWAYLDLFVTGADTFLSEINLSGSNAGMKEYQLNTLKRKMIEGWLADG